MSFDDALTAAEHRLLELADGLDVPIEGKGRECALAIGLGLHARDLYRGLLRECATGGIATAMVTLRSLVEAAILVRWIEKDPPLHVDMYFAEDDRQRLAGAIAFDELRRRRSWPNREPVFPAELDRDMRTEIRRVRDRARRAGEPVREQGAVLPHVEQMADVNDTALWEAYQVVYRIVSPWTHVGGRALVGHLLESRPDGTHVVPGALWTAASIKAIAAPAVAILIGGVSRICGLGVDGECRGIQDALTLWPTEVFARDDRRSRDRGQEPDDRA